MWSSEINYKRSKLHDEFGGNRQSGISYPANQPYVFLFTGKSGEDSGYQDGWEADDRFWYSGQGRTGDMEFKLGNKAILDHQINGKELHLFEALQTKGFVQYVGQFELENYRFRDNVPDSEGSLRRAIQFGLRPVGEVPRLNAPEVPIGDRNQPNTTERKGLVTSRVGQGWYRQRLLERWESRCAVTGLAIPEILIASHIVPWRDASDLERLDIDNGLLLSPDIDALFDKHLISFQLNGQILIHSSLEANSLLKIGVHDSLKISHVYPGMRPYLQKHQDRFHETS